MKNVNQKRVLKRRCSICIIKTLDNFGIIATTSSSVTLSTTRSGLMVLSVSTAFVCGITLKNKASSKVFYV